VLRRLIPCECATAVVDREGAADEQRLARKAADGDQTAFVTLFEAHQRAVYRIGAAVTGDHEAAKDVVQETFLKVYRGLGAWRGDAALRTWIHRIAVRCAIDQQRGSARYARTLPPGREPVHDPRPGLEDAIALRRLREMAEKVSGQQGLVLRLRLLGDLTNAEIAAALGLTPANVRMQMSKAIRRLREML